MTPAPAAPATSARSIDPLRTWRIYWKLSAVTALLGVLLGTPIAWWKGKAVYYTEASIYVSPRFVKNLEDDKEFEMQSNSQYREFVQQQVRTINRFDIVSEALDRMGATRALFQKAGDSPRRTAERLQGTLEVRPVADTYQITVGLSGDSPAGLAELVNTVTAVYIAKDRSERFFDVDSTLTNLKSERSRLTEEVAAKEAARTQLSQELGVATFSESYVNPYDQLLTNSKAAHAAAAQRRFEAEAQFKVIDPSHDTGTKGALTALAAEMASKDAAITSLQANFNLRRSDLLSRVSGLGESHPGRKAASRELEDIDQTVQHTQARLADWYGSNILEQRRAESQRALQVEQNLEQEVKRQFSEAARFSESYLRALNTGRDLDRLRKRLDAVEDRISFLNLELKAPGFMRIFSAARTPEVPVRGGRTKLALLFLGAAFGLALVLPLVLDFFDPRLRSTEELGRLLSFSPMGWVVEKSQETKELHTEQIRRLAASILRDQEMQGSRAFAFTGVAAGSGTTEVLIAVSQELSRLGVKTLFVEANATHADVRIAPAGPSRKGLAGVLRGKTTLSEEVVPGGDGLPDRVPVGQVESQRLEGLADFRTMLSTIPDCYQIVLVDVPPLVLSADAELLVRGADVAVLVVEAETTTSGQVRRVARILEAARPRAAGAVINRVRPFRLPALSKDLARSGSGREPSRPRLLAPWLWT